MKFKLIQFATLLAFVMFIVYMVQAHDGLENSDDMHPPDIWINATSGGLESPSENLTDTVQKIRDLVGSEIDPRGKNFSAICGVNGSCCVVGWGWYYRGGKLSLPHAHARILEDGSTTGSDARQQVFTIVIQTTAEANKT